MEFSVRNTKDLGVGALLLILSVTYIAFAIFSDRQGFWTEVLVSGFLVSVTSAFLFSYFAVQSIKITEKFIVLDPISVKIDRSQIESGRLTWPEFFEQRGELNRVIFTTKNSGFVWVPFNVLWIEKQVSIKLVGVRDGAQLISNLPEIKY